MCEEVFWLAMMPYEHKCPSGCDEAFWGSVATFYKGKEHWVGSSLCLRCNTFWKYKVNPDKPLSHQKLVFIAVKK